MAGRGFLFYEEDDVMIVFISHSQSPPRYFTNLMASGGAKSLQSEDKFFCLANEFDASTPVKKQRSSPLLPPPKQNIWQDALEKNVSRKMTHLIITHCNDFFCSLS